MAWFSIQACCFDDLMQLPVRARKGIADYTHYNDRVNPATAEHLLELNRRFYAERGRDFSDTRLRVQPGVRRILETLRGNEAILDLGCGNGAFALALSRNSHRGRYLGIDFSASLLEDAHRARYNFPVQFLQTDLMALVRGGGLPAKPVAAPPRGSVAPAPGDSFFMAGGWSLITAFAVLHHIPGVDLRLALLRQIRHWLEADGLFILSNWQFSESPRLQRRIQPWSTLGLEREVDTGDFLMEWRRGGQALRYVHEFHEDELVELATQCGFAVATTFYSDGADRRSGLYEVWRPL